MKLQGLKRIVFLASTVGIGGIVTGAVGAYNLYIGFSPTYCQGCSEVGASYKLVWEHEELVLPATKLLLIGAILAFASWQMILAVMAADEKQVNAHTAHVAHVRKEAEKLRTAANNLEKCKRLKADMHFPQDGLSC